MKTKTIVVSDKMQKNYRYQLMEPIGKNFRSDFEPELTPKEMLRLGVFGGRYMRDCASEFPDDWFSGAKFHAENTPGHNPKLNFFEVDASQPLSVWRKKGWIHEDDPRGWFQWYCRYYMGRRHEDDDRQIKRWRAFKRHWSAVKNNCEKGDLSCRKKQRQALLHWAYDSRKI
ncbi:MAG: hypothetical protein OEV93_05255 [Candidatus Moranbacteria bacterium]|nr:hypothetical protein [Candidatus Moranbacteria bacterium]